MDKKNKKRFIILTIILFIWTCVANFAHAVTPEKNASLGYQTFFFSIMYMFMACGQIFGSNFWGYRSDKIGRKPFMIMAGIVYAITQFLFGVSSHPAIILVLRILSGFFSVGMFIGANAYLVDITTKENRFYYVTKFTAITSLGTSFGYFIGGVVGASDYHYAFYFQSFCSLALALAVYLFLDEPERGKAPEAKGFFSRVKSIKDPLAYVIVFMILLSQAGFTLYNNSSQQYLKLQLDFTPDYFGYYMAFSGILGIVMNLLIFPIIKRHFKITTITVMNFVLIIISGYFAIANLSSLNLVFFISLVVFLLNISLFIPLLTAILSNYSKNSNGLIMGLRQSFIGMGSMTGSLYAGLVFDRNNYFAFYSIIVMFIIALIPLVINYKKFIAEE